MPPRQGSMALDATTTATLESSLTSFSNVTTVGTLTTGVWQASIIARNYGGTGIDASSLSNGQLLIGGSSGFSKATLAIDQKRLDEEVFG